MMSASAPALSATNSPETRRLQLMHRARAQEIGLAFARTPKGAFARGLELGAGDCYQSQYLKRYVGDLTCTDFDEALLSRSDPEITYGQCDAEQVDRVFAGQRFDLVFTSNMMPHTPNPRAVLTGLQKVTDDHAILVMVVPSPMWKIVKLAAFYPLLLMGLPRRLLKYASKRMTKQEAAADSRGRGVKLTNNPKAPRQMSRWRQKLLPVPVGVYSGNLAEVYGSRRTRWIPELNQAGWQVVRIYRGPFIVGEMNQWWNDTCARVGLSTENIYVAKKHGCRSRYEPYFL